MVVFAVSALTLATMAPLALGASGGNIPPSPIQPPSPPPVFDPNAPTISNIGFTVNGAATTNYDIASGYPLLITYDYTNIAANNLPQQKIYKEGDASKTDLSKNKH